MNIRHLPLQKLPDLRSRVMQLRRNLALLPAMYASIMAMPSAAAAQPTASGTAVPKPAVQTFSVSRWRLQLARPLPPETSTDGPRSMSLLDDLYRSSAILQCGTDGTLDKSEIPPSHAYTLEELNASRRSYTPEAVRAIQLGIASRLNSVHHLIAVIVMPQSDMPDPVSGEWVLGVTLSNVSEVRTVDQSEGVPPEDRVDSRTRMQTRIRENSPVGVGDLVDQQAIDDYVARLNRHPLRRIDAAVSPARPPKAEEAFVNEVSLDYLVTASKPWLIYGQISNTGTSETSKWRERFGFSHAQLTGNDDNFLIDYSTAGFQDSHDVTGSYDFPMTRDGRLRSRLFSGYNTYTASDVGLSNQNFKGEGWDAGGEIIWNFFQRGNLFLDAFAGARYERTRTKNQTPGFEDQRGNSGFFIPSVGIQLERFVDSSTTYARCAFECNAANLGDTDDAQDLAALGRIAPDRSWSLLKYELGHSFYLEPLLENGPRTLAHEFAVSLRGQWTFDSRLVPTQEEVVGGLGSVRGYPQSIVAGDSTFVASFEYRLHVPRLFTLDANDASDRERMKRIVRNGEFKWQPVSEFGLADWDLIVRPFLDVGYVDRNKVQLAPFENGYDTLVGSGIGVELQVSRNVNVRVDWGIALKELDDFEGRTIVSEGSQQWYIVATFAF